MHNSSHLYTNSGNSVTWPKKQQKHHHPNLKTGKDVQLDIWLMLSLMNTIMVQRALHRDIGVGFRVGHICHKLNKPTVSIQHAGLYSQCSEVGTGGPP